jgi:molybdenum cofactor synthesis domain-containing protein
VIYFLRFPMPRTAGIIIIGNEILSGRIQDANSSYLASELRALGVDVRRISVIPDEVDAIAEEVSAFSRRFDLVFTAGGVGPTHDDVTMQGIARGFGLGTVVNGKLAEIIRERCGIEANDSAMKMAEVPEGAEVIEVEGLRFPPVVIRNVHVFPGIPEFLRNKFSALRERFRSEPYMLKKVFVNEEECYIAGQLDALAGEFGGVIVGSYPKVNEPGYKVVVTLESTDPGALSRAYQRLMALLPRGTVVRSE